MPVDGRRKPWPGRFFEKVQKGQENECWLWTACRNDQGYGSAFTPRGTHDKAHRVSWELHFGPIPPGQGPHGTCVLHRCDNPSCVNPNHLFLGTNRDNAIDRQRKGRTKCLELGPKKNSAKPTCPAGHPVNEINTGRRRNNGTRYCRVCQRNRSAK